MTSLRERLDRWWEARTIVGGTTTLYVDRGIVPCPAEGDVSIELCLACPHLRAMDGYPAQRIRCQPGLARTLEHLSPAAG